MVRRMAAEIARFLARFAASVAMCTWIGGFMFYGGLVVPILEDALGRYDAGMITRKVTVGLNLIGAVSVVLGFLLIWAERRIGGVLERGVRLALALISAASLVGLFVLHSRMDRWLDTVGLRGFRAYHRLYLMVSTGQWLANLGIIALTIRIWTSAGRSIAPAGISEMRKDHA